MADSFENLLRNAFPFEPPEPGAAGVIRAASARSTSRSQVEIVQKIQYGLYVAFQALVFALAAAVVVSLIISIWRLTAHPDTSQAILSGVVVLGDIVTGAAAGFVQKQANVAKQRYEDATRYLGNA